MPYTKNNPPKRISNLPEKAQSIWISAFNAALEQYDSEEKANQVAWAAVKKKYKKQGDDWVKKASEFIGQVSELNKLEFSFGDGKYVSEIEVLRPGKWDHPKYGEFEITTEDISKFADSLAYRKGIPIDVEHQTKEGAVGWVKELIDKGRQGLKAIVEWTKEGYELISEGKFRFFSPEFQFQYEDPETRQEHENVLLGGAITNRPYFKGLGELVLSEQFAQDDNKSYNQSEEESSETQEGGEIIVAKDEKEKVPSEEELEEEVAEESVEEEEAPESEDESDEAVQATEETVSVKASEYERLQKELSEAKELATGSARKLRRMELQEKVGGYVYSEERNPDGKILPKDKSDVVKFMEGLNPQQERQFLEILDKLPEGNLFAEMGGSGERTHKRSPEDTHEESFDLAEEAKALAEEKGIHFNEAVEKLVETDKRFADVASGDYLK